MPEEIIYKEYEPRNVTENLLLTAIGKAVKVMFGEASIAGELTRKDLAYGATEYAISTFKVAFVSRLGDITLSDGMTSFMVQDAPWAEIRDKVDEEGYVIITGEEYDKLTARQHISYGIDFPIETEFFTIGEEYEDVRLLIHRL